MFTQFKNHGGKIRDIENQIEFFTLFTIFTNNVKSGFFSNSLKIPNDQKIFNVINAIFHILMLCKSSVLNFPRIFSTRKRCKQS